MERIHPDAVFTSALTGEGLDDLREAIFQLLDSEAQEIALELPAANEQTGKILAQIARHGRILSQDWDEEGGANPILCVKARLAPRWFELCEIERFLVGTQEN